MARRTDAAFDDDEMAAFLLGVWTPVRSSNVREARYLEGARLLEVTFRGQGGKPDTHYAYPNVDFSLARIWGEEPSKGGAVWDLFRTPGRPFVRYGL